MGGKVKIDDSGVRNNYLNNLITNLQFDAKENGNLIEFSSKPIKYLHLSEITPIGMPCKEFNYRSLSLEEAIPHPSSEEKDKLIKKIKSEELSIKDFFEFVGRAIFFFENKDLSELFAETITPAFQKRFPKGSIHLLQVDPLLLSREAYARLVMASKELPDLLDFKKKEEFQGFQSMRALQSTLAINTIDSYLPLILLGFRPEAYGIFKAKISGSFIFLFGEPVHLIETYPQTFASFFIPKDFLNVYKGSPEDTYEVFHHANWPPEQYNKLFYSFIDRLNNLIDYFYDISNFTDLDGYIDGLKAFNSIYTINRIAAETSLILTEYQKSLVTIPFSFAIFDKIANLIMLFKGTNEVDVFKKLVCKEEMIKLQSLFDYYPAPFNNFFRNRFKKAFDGLNTKVLDSIFLKKRIIGDSVVLDTLNPKNNLEKKKYISEFIRALRNTHHGYAINASQLKKLIISNCSIGKEVEYLSYFIVLMLLANPQEFIDNF